MMPYSLVGEYLPCPAIDKGFIKAIEMSTRWSIRFCQQVKAGLTIKDIDLVEVNEAFTAQPITFAREMEFEMSKINVNGGAIARHPVGYSGASIIITLPYELQKRSEAKKSLATLCIGGGIGVPLF